MICTSALEKKIASITDSDNETAKTMIYTLFDSNIRTEPLYIPERALTCPLPSLNDEPDDNKRITRILKDFIMADPERREA